MSEWINGETTHMQCHQHDANDEGAIYGYFMYDLAELQNAIWAEYFLFFYVENIEIHVLHVWKTRVELVSISNPLSNTLR